MASVTGLTIRLQTGSNTHFATWSFNPNTGSSSGSGSGSSTGGSSTTTTAIKVGSLVSIKPGAKYYNGVAIPSWVMSRKWYVVQVKGDRAVLGKDSSGAYDIQSPINVKDITTGSTASRSTDAGTTSRASNVSADTLDHYEVKWYYDTGNGVWFSGGESTTKETNSTYNAPDNALKVKVSVKPVSKTYTSNNKETSYWTGTWVSAEYSVSVDPPDDAPVPTVKIEGFTLTATVDNITDPRTDKIQFQVYDGDTLFSTGTVNVVACRAVYTCTIKAGGNYRVRCKAININSTSNNGGDWSDFTGESSTIPTAVTNPTVVADSKNSVRVSWSAVATAKSYEVEYAIKREYFDSSSQVSSVTVTSTTAYITGLEADEWFFRVRAINEAGESAWSNIVSVIIGSKPEPPTTWSLTTTVILGETVTLYWVHNTEDGSRQVSAEIQLDVGGKIHTITVNNNTPEDEDDEEPVCFYTFDPRTYTSGAAIKWKVRTKGITGEFGDWSTQRTLNVYAPPTLAVSLSTNTDGVLETLPLNIKAIAGPVEQTPISYYISIVANTTYETEDAIGNSVMVSAGSEVYSKLFNSSKWELEASISAGDISLENDQSYTVNVTVSMNSGLTANNTSDFSVTWEERDYVPDASVAIDLETLSAYITPYCVDEGGGLPTDVTLAVYRREFDGSFTKIGSGMANDKVTTVTDPHPSLDYARYRIVAQQTSTGAITFEDLPGQPVGEHAIVIQWDEKWTEFDHIEGAATVEPPWVGSMIRLSYNIDVTMNYDPDVSLVEYIGRKHPISYYGTQRGESATWSTEIDKRDTELIYALRRLAAWNGDVYVREPSGTGYWAQLTVSMPRKHLATTIPVTFDIKRVEGDVV